MHAFTLCKTENQPLWFIHHWMQNLILYHMNDVTWYINHNGWSIFNHHTQLVDGNGGKHPPWNNSQHCPEWVKLMFRYYFYNLNFFLKTQDCFIQIRLMFEKQNRYKTSNATNDQTDQTKQHRIQWQNCEEIAERCAGWIKMEKIWSNVKTQQVWDRLKI